MTPNTLAATLYYTTAVAVKKIKRGDGILLTDRDGSVRRWLIRRIETGVGHECETRLTIQHRDGTIEKIVRYPTDTLDRTY